MDTDKQVVTEADLALVAATRKYIQAPPWEKPNIQPSLNEARARWAAARYRLLFPDTVTIQQDVLDARTLRVRIEAAADTQQMVQALLDLGGMLVKFAH
jgi:hypothetical protein